MIYGSAYFGDRHGVREEIVQIIKQHPRTTTVRRTYKGVPFGKPIKRHNIKHCVKKHGKNVIRRDWLNINKGLYSACPEDFEGEWEEQ